MQDLLFSVFAFLLVATACSPSNNNYIDTRDVADLVSINEPEPSTNADTATIYIDSVALANHNDQTVLLVSGDFPDGCTQLKEANHTWKNDIPSVQLKAWRDPDQMCTQALSSFSYIYENISEDELTELDSIFINDQSFTLY